MPIIAHKSTRLEDGRAKDEHNEQRTGRKSEGEGERRGRVDRMQTEEKQCLLTKRDVLLYNINNTDFATGVLESIFLVATNW